MKAEFSYPWCWINDSTCLAWVHNVRARWWLQPAGWCVWLSYLCVYTVGCCHFSYIEGFICVYKQGPCFYLLWLQEKWMSWDRSPLLGSHSSPLPYGAALSCYDLVTGHTAARMAQKATHQWRLTHPCPGTWYSGVVNVGVEDACCKKTPTDINMG